MLIHAKLTKLSSKPGQPAALSDGYWVKGHYGRGPMIGERFEIDRYERNGIKIDGVLTTSPVLGRSRIDDGWTFETQNSKYLLRFLPSA